MAVDIRFAVNVTQAVWVNAEQAGSKNRIDTHGLALSACVQPIMSCTVAVQAGFVGDDARQALWLLATVIGSSPLHDGRAPYPPT